MKTLKPVDILAGCILAVIGLIVLYGSSMIRVGVERALSPRAFPSAIGAIILVCGAGLALKAWRSRGEDPAIQWPDRGGIRIILVNLALLAGYIALMNPLGLPLSTFLYVACSIWYLEPGKWAKAIVIGLIVGIISYAVFIELLQLSFPMGFLFEG